jgi:hypothetical protein
MILVAAIGVVVVVAVLATAEYWLCFGSIVMSRAEMNTIQQQKCQ